MEILTALAGPAARLRLNRPKALHALNTAMCDAMLDALAAWEHDETVKIVLLDHADGRGFCAGGDIRLIADSGAADGKGAADFFRSEYRLNHRLFTYPKPIAAFMDGITMGGGVGIALPARFRIATENTKFAMPETGIGLFPDVGGGWYLSRLPGRMGEYLALTGHRLDGAECLALGLATHYLPAAALEGAKARIAPEPAQIDNILSELAVVPPAAGIMAHQPDIDRLFAGDSIEAILAALEAEGGDWASATLATLRTKSPQACKVSLRIVREGRTMPDFAAEMVQEYAVATRVCRLPDFAEGVRAVILDKDNAPRWAPSTPQAVDSAAIDAIFAPLPPESAWKP
jgi:enoyl-CoA hydratase